MTPFSMKITNPKTSEDRTLIILADAAAAEAAPCLHSYIQAIGRPEIPDGFMPISCGVSRVLQ